MNKEVIDEKKLCDALEQMKQAEKVITNYFAQKNFENKPDKKLEKIKNKIYNLTCDKLNRFMHDIGAWGDEICLIPFSAENVGIMIADAVRNGYDVELSINKNKDAYIYGSPSDDIYYITGVSDRYDELGILLDIDVLTRRIYEDDELFNYLNGL